MGKQKKKGSASTTSSQLVNELREHNEFFDNCVDLIPSKIYIPGESGDSYNPKYHYMQKEGGETKESRRAAAKLAKRRKLDPELAESTVQKQNRLTGADKPTLPNAKKGELHNNKKENGAAPSSPQGGGGGQSRIEALREKLRAKIAAKQAQRPADGNTPEATSKRAARRAEKKRRQEEAKRKKKAAGGGASSSNSNNNSAVRYKIGSTSDDPSHDLERMDFGRLAGLNQDSNSKSPITSSNYLEANKALANLNKSKNIAKLIADAEAKRLKLQALKQSSSEEDKKKAKAIQWADTFKEADGQRVKDDPKKLKKVLKRKAAKKAKSQKAWKSRLEQSATSKQERQDIRQHNLVSRKQGGKVGANLSRKRIVDNTTTASDDKDHDVGRRLSRAGFEGRKKDFINNKNGKE